MEETLGKRIMTNRKRLGLTQDKLAEILGVTAQAVSKWENDQSCPDITMLPQLADIFGITTDELLGRESVTVAIPTEDFEETETVDTHEGSGMEWYYEGGKKGALTLAVFVLLVGVLTFLSKLYWGVSFWNILWPCAILMFGVGGILHKFSFFSIACTLLGGYFLLDNLNVIHDIQRDLSRELIFPILILIFGVALLIDALKKPLHPRQRFHRISRNGKTQNHFASDGEQFTCALSFGESHRPVAMPRLSRGDISCSFGELTILVPRNIRVEVDQDTSFGAVNIQGSHGPDPDASIRIDADVSFGQIIIQYV